MDALRGRALAEVFNPADLGPLEARLDRARQSGASNPPALVRARRADGSFAQLEMVSMSVDFEGQPAVMAIGRDVTERLALQEKLKVAERLAAVGTLAAGVAHEINNPIAFVINNMAVLRRDVEGLLDVLDRYGEARESLAQSEPALAAEVARLQEEMDLPYFRENHGRMFDSSADGLRRIRTIVQNLRDFARLDEAEYKEVDLNAALRSTLEALGHELNQKALRVETSLEAIPPLPCHPGKINQLFFHILQNAIQASEREGLIEVRTRPDGGDAVLIEIEDHGTGIRPEHVPHIFEPFFTTKPVGGGAGLGLSVSYGIVRDHGGSLEVKSTVGEGSLFRIRLPVAPAGQPGSESSWQEGRSPRADG
jgi:signal transduction histidine kinase